MLVNQKNNLSCFVYSIIFFTLLLTPLVWSQVGSSNGIIANQPTTVLTVDITSPSNNARVNTQMITVSGWVSDQTAAVMVNGIPSTLEGEGQGEGELLPDFRFIVRPTLTQGPNTITVQAQDQAGNTNQASIDITYNTQTPKVTITSPMDNSTHNISPINVQGTNTTDLKYVIVGSLPARIDEGNFIVEGITLNSAHTVITAEGYDANDNLFEDSVFLTSPQLANYQFTEISGNAYEYDDTRPIAGANQTLKVTLEKNSELAPNEEIQFNIIEGEGILSQSSVFTNDNGEAQVILTTDSDSSVTNKIDCFVTNNPLVKTTFVVYTKPGAPSTLTKVSDDSITPVPGATVDLIVKLTDPNNNPIPNENINFQITQGTGVIASPEGAKQSLAVPTTCYGETKVTLTVSPNPSETTQVTAISATNPGLSVTFNFTTSQPTPLTFGEVMNRVKQNEDLILDLMADVVKTSNEPGSVPEERYKIWAKGNKSKIQLTYPEQKEYIVEETPTSINLDGEVFLTISEGDTDPNITTTREIEQVSGSAYILKTSIKSQDGFGQINRIYVDYDRGVVLKVTDEHSDTYGKRYFEITYSYIMVNNIWIAEKTTTNTRSLLDFNKEYITVETMSNIQLNTGLPDTIFQR